MQSNKIENEIEFHKNVAIKSKSNLIPLSKSIIERYKLSKNWKLFEKELIFKHVREKANESSEPIIVADFGCGDGATSCQIAKIIENTIVYGFDLSPELIEVAKERAAINNISDRTEFLVANAEEDNPLQDKRADVMLCLNILHHVDLSLVMPSLLKATKPDGIIVFQEPIAFSKKLQLLRDSLPVTKDVTPDERQLDKSEIDYLLSIVEPDVVYYNLLLSRLIRFFPNVNKIDDGHPYTKFCVHFMYRTDRLLIKFFPFIKKFCGRVVIIGKVKS